MNHTPPITAAVKTILLVEDNPDDRELTLCALENSRLANRVDIAVDGAEALEYLFCAGKFAGRDASLAPAVVLLDIKLPKIDGLEVLRRIRADERTRFQPVVILTSSREQQDLVAGYSLGANSYIRKPVDFQKFNEAVRQLGLYWLVMNEAPPGAA
ncbi:MAG: response regulator [Opitutae bacterium]|nr:response regulator [Opitutae bacterium]